MAGRIHRGSQKRIDRLSPFEQLPINFWLLMAVAAVMLAIAAAIIYQAM